MKINAWTIKHGRLYYCNFSIEHPIEIKGNVLNFNKGFYKEDTIIEKFNDFCKREKIEVNWLK